MLSTHIIVISSALVLIGLLSLVPALMLFAECILFVAGHKSGSKEGMRAKQPTDAGHAPSTQSAACQYVVLMPAHDEAAVIQDTVLSLIPHLGNGGSLLVVADNCTDATASLALAAGAGVTERHDTGQRGKGFALDWGVRQLAADPPDVVLVVDADCTVTGGSLCELAEEAHRTGLPVQCIDLMTLSPDPSLSQRLSAFAWKVKNVVRPCGGAVIGVPCPLLGTGMAIPWRLLAGQISLANASLVEDMQLGVDLAVGGTPATFFAGAEVSSPFPTSEIASQTQKTRWEQGTLSTIVAQVPRLFAQSVKQRRWELAGMALDLSIPPLALLATLITANVLISGLWWLFTGHLLALALSLLTLTLLSTAVLLSWNLVGKNVISGKQLLGVPLYMAAKLPIYGRWLLGRRQTDWVRTERDPKK